MSDSDGTADSGIAIFGILDGLVSVLGVILGLLATSPHTIVRAAVGLAAASSASMGAGEYLGDANRSVGRAARMAGATLIGTLAPIVPFVLLPKGPAIVAAAALTVLFGA